MPTQGGSRSGKKKGQPTMVGLPKSGMSPDKDQSEDGQGGSGGVETFAVVDVSDDLPEQNPTVMKQAAELLEEALLQAGGSLDDIGELGFEDEKSDDSEEPAETAALADDAPESEPEPLAPAPEPLAPEPEPSAPEPEPEASAPASEPSSPLANLFPDEVDDEELEVGALLGPSSIDKELAHPEAWVGDDAKPSTAGDERAKPEKKGGFITTGWLIGVVLAIGIGVGVAYVATQMKEKSVAETDATPSSTAPEPEPTEPSEPEPEPTAASPASASSAAPAPSASASASASTAGSASAVVPQPGPRPPVRPRPPPPPPPRGGNLEDIYE